MTERNCQKVFSTYEVVKTAAKGDEALLDKVTYAMQLCNFGSLLMFARASTSNQTR